MNETILAGRYAAAIFQLASEAGIVDRLGQEIDSLRDIIENNPKWQQILGDIKISQVAKDRMIDDLASSSKLHHYTRDLLKTAVKRKRICLWGEIARCYKKEGLNLRGEIEVVVEVADRRVYTGLKKEIENTVGKLTGRRAVLTCLEDRSLIGGLSIKINGSVYDGSIRGELKRFRDSLVL